MTCDQTIESESDTSRFVVAIGRMLVETAPSLKRNWTLCIAFSTKIFTHYKSYVQRGDIQGSNLRIA